MLLGELHRWNDFERRPTAQARDDEAAHPPRSSKQRSRLFLMIFPEAVLTFGQVVDA